MLWMNSLVLEPMKKNEWILNRWKAKSTLAQRGGKIKVCNDKLNAITGGQLEEVKSYCSLMHTVFCSISAASVHQWHLFYIVYIYFMSSFDKYVLIQNLGQTQNK